MYTESKALKKVDFDFGEKMKLSKPATKNTREKQQKSYERDATKKKKCQ